MGDAVQLVSFGGNKQLVLHEEGLRTLRLFTSSLSILSVVGPSRCGKSTLCNVILEVLGVNTTGRKLFSVGGGSTPVTSGIWVWSQPIPVPGKPNSQLLLMDTEGLDRGEDHELRMITSVACLLSSNLIFNTRGEPSNADLKNTAVMGEVVRLTRGGITTDFPNLLLLSRDITPEWLAATQAQGHTMDTLVREWLDATNASQVTQQHARTARECFPNVRMVTVPAPERVDNKLPELVPGTPFTTSIMATVRNEIIAKLTEKTVGGVVSNGPLLANNFLPNAIAALNRRDPLSIPSLTDAYAASVRSTLVASATQYYVARWNGVTLNTLADVQTHHAAQLTIATRDMQEKAKAYFPPNSLEFTKVKNELEAACQPEFLRRQNEVSQRLAAEAERERKRLEEQRKRDEEARVRAAEQLRKQQEELARLQEHNRRLQGHHLAGNWRGTGMRGTFNYTLRVAPDGQLQGLVQAGHPFVPAGTLMFTVRMQSPMNGAGQSRRPRHGNMGPCTLAVQNDNHFTVTSHGHRGTRVRTFTRI